MAFKIGVMSDSFRLGVREGVRKAKEVGAEGFQIYAVRGEFSPDVLDGAARKEFRRFVDDCGLEISALCGDAGDLESAEANREKVPRLAAIVDLAADLGARAVTTHVGVIPADPADPVYGVLKEACRDLGEHAAGKGVTFAIETGPEKASVLKAFLDDVGSEGMGVNLDPANFVMVTAQDPVEAVRLLGPYIVHTHAKDGIQRQPCDPAEVYHAFASGGFGELEKRMGTLFEEVPLGEGGVDWDGYLAALEEAGFDGYLTIEREVGENPEADIRKAVAFLREKTGAEA